MTRTTIVDFKKKIQDFHSIYISRFSKYLPHGSYASLSSLIHGCLNRNPACNEIGFLYLFHPFAFVSSWVTTNGFALNAETLIKNGRDYSKINKLHIIIF